MPRAPLSSLRQPRAAMRCGRRARRCTTASAFPRWATRYPAGTSDGSGSLPEGLSAACSSSSSKPALLHDCRLLRFSSAVHHSATGGDKPTVLLTGCEVLSLERGGTEER